MVMAHRHPVRTVTTVIALALRAKRNAASPREIPFVELALLLKNQLRELACVFKMYWSFFGSACTSFRGTAHHLLLHLITS